MKKKKKKPAPAAKKAKRRPAPAPKKQKKKPTTGPKKPTKKPAPKKPPKKPATAATERTPDICVDNFSAKNGDTVNFQAFPVPSVTITQVSGYSYPFTPITGKVNGLDYTTIASGDVLTISVPAVNQTYPYALSCTCDPDNPAHSVTVDS